MIRAIALQTLTALIIIAGAFLVLVNMPVAAERNCGLASWYGTESGNRTANGERFTGREMTAAHKTLPFGTRLRVTYRGHSVVVRINDRGPFVAGRVLDLSYAAANRIGLIKAGVGKVCWIRL